MPLYEYVCRECEHRFEVLQRLGEGGEQLECPRCQTPRPEKAFSTFAATTAGGGAAASAGSCGNSGCGAGFS